MTNGWDAICALNAAQASAILFQQYLKRGPANPFAIQLRAILPPQDAYDFWLLDLNLGPPDISFTGDLTSQQCRVEMFLTGKRLVSFYADGSTVAIKSAVRVRPDESWLTGAVNLAKVRGTDNDIGQIQVDLASGAYQPKIAWIDPASPLPAQIGLAVQSFFANNATTYELGTLRDSTVPACLQPTDFRFLTQRAPSGGNDDQSDGCVAILIRTNGQDGTLEPLTPYPIPPGQTAAVLVSNQVVFNQLLPADLDTQFQPVGTVFSGQGSGDTWQTRGNGGVINLGVLGNTSNHNAYSSDGHENATAVQVSTDGLMVSAADGNLSVTWNQTWDQDWTYFTYIQGNDGWMPAVTALSLAAGYSSSWTPAVDPATDMVSFSGNGSGKATLTATGDKSLIAQIMDGQYGVKAQFDGVLQDYFQSFFSKLHLPKVNTFVLSNILFPERHDALQLTQASVPGDLVLTGQVASSWKVSPASVRVKPGDTVQFTATLNGAPAPATAVTWSATAKSIDTNGLYTAPTTIDDVEVVVITAVDNDDPSHAARAMVLVYEAPAATGLVINPSELLVTQRSPFGLLVTDDQGNPVEDVDCTVPTDRGFVAKDPGSPGLWTYFPPQTVQEPCLITLTAVSNTDPSKTGAATIQLATIETVAITPATSSLTANQTLSMQASAETLDDFTWVSYPTGIGSIASDDTDSSLATYSAPASIASRTRVTIAAYGIDSGVAGIALAYIDLSPAGTLL